MYKQLERAVGAMKRGDPNPLIDVLEGLSDIQLAETITELSLICITAAQLASARARLWTTIESAPPPTGTKVN